jgi:hypothetical protein
MHVALNFVNNLAKRYLFKKKLCQFIRSLRSEDIRTVQQGDTRVGLSLNPSLPT